MKRTCFFSSVAFLPRQRKCGGLDAAAADDHRDERKKMNPIHLRLFLCILSRLDKLSNLQKGSKASVEILLG